MYRNQSTGHLNVGTTRTADGKVIDKWTFTSPYSHGAARNTETRDKLEKLTVDLVIFKQPDGSITFRARGKCLPGGFIEHTDIEALRQAVETCLQEQHDVLMGCQWEDWLEVRVQRNEPFSRESSGITVGVEYRVIKRTVDAQGKAWGLSRNNLVSPFPEPKRAGVKDPADSLDGFRTSDRKAEDEYSYIKATPENIAALEGVTARFEALHQALATLLQQGSITESLRDERLLQLSLSAPAPRV